MLKLGEHFTLPLDAVTETLAVLAMRGAGKSNTAAVMAEQMFAHKIPFVVVDPDGSWWGLRSSGSGHGPGLAIPIFGGRHGDVPLEKTGGVLIADLIVSERVSSVLDLSGFESEGGKKQFLLDFARRLYQKNEEPLHLFLEEADDYIPQKPMRDEAQLLRAWENIVRRGRKRGLGLTMITQRSAVLNKNVLTQVGTLIVLRTTAPQDQDAIEAWIKYHSQSLELLKSLSGLDDGEAWIWSPFWMKMMKCVQIRRRDTFDSAATPKLTKAHRPAANLADVDLDAVKAKMAATIERAKADDPRELRRRIAELERALQTAPKLRAAPPVETKTVPALKDGPITRLEALCSKIMAEADRHGKAMSLYWDNQSEVARALLDALRAISKARSATPRQSASAPATASALARAVASNGELGHGGLRRILTALAQSASCRSSGAWIR